MLRLGLGLGPSKQGGGGGGDVTGPVVTDIAYTPGALPADPDELTMTVDENCTGYFLHNASATPLTAAFIKANAEVTQAFGIGIGYAPMSDAAWGAGTWYIHGAFEDLALNTSTITPIEHIIPIPGFVQTWSGYTVGDTNTQLDALFTGYTSITSVTALVVTDAGSPSSKGLQLTGTTANERALYQDDIAAALAVRTTERINYLGKFRMGTAANARSSFGFMLVSENNTGAVIWRNATNWTVSVQLDGNVSSLTNKTDVLAGIADSAIIWIRVEVDGLDVKMKAWADGAGEPGAWMQTRTAASAIAMTRLDMLARTATLLWTQLGYSIGIGADAAGF